MLAVAGILIQPHCKIRRIRKQNSQQSCKQRSVIKLLIQFMRGVVWDNKNCCHIFSSRNLGEKSNLPQIHEVHSGERRNTPARQDGAQPRQDRGRHLHRASGRLSYPQGCQFFQVNNRHQFTYQSICPTILHI